MVYIDIEKPSNCVECFACRHDNWNDIVLHQCNIKLITFDAKYDDWIYSQTPNWCPLIELNQTGECMKS